MEYIDNIAGIKLAYIHSAPNEKGAKLPAVMFLGGFKSDMSGTKAVYLEEQCKSRGQEFIRFDYTGHGRSGGKFIDGTIGSWKSDALHILDNIVKRDVVLVGSSMGGWISLLLLLESSSLINSMIKGMVGIACAPDFTKDIEALMTDEQREMFKRSGRLEIPNDYSDEPYIFTKALLDDGKKHSILGKKYGVNIPITLIQGKQDADVEWEKALKINSCFTAQNIDIVFIDDGDHSLSRPQDLHLIDRMVRKMSGA